MSKEQQEEGKPEFTFRLLSNNLPTGDWQYHCTKRIPLVEYELWNKTKEKNTFILISKITGYSEEQKNSPTLEPGEHVICRQLPLLSGDKVSQLKSNTPATVSICISNSQDEKPLSEDHRITLMSYKTILWDMQDLSKKGKRVFLLKHIVAWIDRQDEDVEKQWRVAFNSIEDYPGFPYPEAFDPAIPKKVVEAIFNTLRNNDLLRYDASTFQVEKLSEGEKSQSIQRPGETLKRTLGNCIDGAVLYASIMLLAGLDPVIVIQEGHAFVGWKTWNDKQWRKFPDDKKYDFLETKWTSKKSGKTFEEACEEGKRLYEEILANKWLKRPPFHHLGFASRLDIRDLRTRLGREKREVFCLEKVIVEPPNEKQSNLPSSITTLPLSDNGPRMSQEKYLRAVSNYIIGVKQSLARIPTANSGQMTKNDCDFTIDILDLIRAPDLPEVESIFSEERQWTYKLDALWKAVIRLKSSIDALRLRHTLTPNSRSRTSLPLAQVQRSLSDPAIAALYGELLQMTEKIASDLKVAMTPEKPDTSKAETG